jgi:hypothetical protein
MSAQSKNWWTPSVKPGPMFSGQLDLDGEREAEEQNGRASERVPIEIGAGLRQRGASGVSIQVMDLSIHGFRAATHLDLPPGTDVWLRLPGLEPFHANVAWAKGHFVGCRFERPLHPAVLEMIVRKASGR